MKNYPQWKTKFHGRQLLLEDNLQLKWNFDGGQPLMEDNHQCKMTLIARQTSEGEKELLN